MAERGRPRGFDRTEALERAMRLFWSRGYGGASLSELTKAMGINAPSLYAAFGSKEALFRESVAHYAEHHGVDIWRALEEAPAAREAMERFLLETAKAYSAAEDPRGCLIVLGAQQEHGDDNAANCELRARRCENLRQIADRLTRAIVEGELPSRFAVREAAAFYLSVQTGMSVLARDGADRETLEAVARGAMLGWDRWSGCVPA